ncbi:uncharacterized protein LOC111702358 [Eurytemora carolleeae]|uniref:uncharacterized protein LOC111702358 n=1 Tax=Eurytemora carolleeae TaxID=1294199 RepID=UPI000C766CBE|nr:uncharacterized protein LOC111702358 [Eurytemora carolleeae]|eukprot:XP_023329784.1 uncharacterized protein LOC111702358 [Eurytemora affinis]
MYCLYCTDQMSNKIEIISRQIDNKTDEAVVRLNDLEMKLNTLTIDILTKKQEKSEPIWPMFDCSRTSRLHDRGIITYNTCLVDTTNGSMNPATGIFTTADSQPGIYQISFTAKYVAHSNGKFGAWSDIMVNDKVVGDSQREYNGNSRTESSTHTVILLHILRAADTVRVQFNKDGSSYIHSDDDHDVHFTVRKVADIPSFM